MKTIWKGAAIGAAFSLGFPTVMTGAAVLWMVTPPWLMRVFSISREAADFIQIVAVIAVIGTAAGAWIGWQIDREAP